MFAAFEAEIKEGEIKKLEQSKKEWKFWKKCALKGNEILMNNKWVEELSAVELEKLLLMHQIPKSKMENKHKR